MSIAQQAAQGVAWNIVFGVGSRVLQLLGTLVLTRFIAPDAYGAVLAASIAVQTAGIATSFAFGQYLIAQRPDAKVAFQAAIVHVLLGIATMSVVVGLRSPLAAWLQIPALAAFLPGFALAHMLDRLRYVPERLLTRELRFPVVAVINGTAELLFTAVALLLVKQVGATAIMLATIARSGFCTCLFAWMAPREQWLVPSRLTRPAVRSLLGYGTPIMLSSISDHAATRLDNIVMSKLFGPGVMALYNLAYSLAEMPVNSVAGNIAEVLMPSYSKMAAAQRDPAVVKSAALMTLVVAPLGVGLGAVAPTLVAAFFDARWVAMAPMLMILSVMTIFRPMSWPVTAYLQAAAKTRLVMYASVSRALFIIASVGICGLLGGPLWAAAGACIGYAFHTAFTITAAGLAMGMPIRAYLAAVARPFVLCVPMFFGTIALGSMLKSAGLPNFAILSAQIIGGAVIYVSAAFIFARPITMTLLKLVASAAGRRAPVLQTGPD
jgi:lipopolysaccharide exporter